MSLAVALALAGFEPALRLVDDVYTALATHDAAVAVPVLERAERVANLHGASSLMSVARSSAGLRSGADAPVSGAARGDPGWRNKWWAIQGSNL